ncbi:MAG: hypothetical protein HWD57_02575 [Candidatus Accumulibacter cognatus]|uniref:Uncharacterized protein n=1 Tax=Candidatus Accumulibacter cognatus TaxID=2954383 RepID=A0A7D5N8T4_9PROT|nr:MAG: hypothetical protein HWD57_02575 [Candidatus Accumulibacter cognatus]
MFYITFHGGRVGTAINNVHVYDLIDGHPVCLTTAALQTPPGSPVLSELRDLVFGPSGHLFVINGYKDASQVLCYSAIPDADHRHAYQGIYADARVSDGIVHPFALAFDGRDNGYLSSQDSNVVTALKPPGTGKRSPALAVAAGLRAQKGKRFLKGTFVASSRGKLPASPARPPSNCRQPAGLAVVVAPDPSKKHPKRTKVAHSVRDVLVYGNSLYVADEPGNAVKIYDLAEGKTRGQLQGQIADAQFLQAPVHLLAHGDDLYIGSSGTDTILQYHFGSGELKTVVRGVRTISGMCFDAAGNFYVASRDDKAIYCCGADFGPPRAFISGLQDNPEFLVYAAN